MPSGSTTGISPLTNPGLAARSEAPPTRSEAPQTTRVAATPPPPISPNRPRPTHREDAGLFTAGTQLVADRAAPSGGRAPSSATALLERPAEQLERPADLLERPSTTSLLEAPPVPPRFDFAPIIEAEQADRSWRRRLLQGLLLLAIVGGTGALAFALPEGDGQAGDEVTARVEAVDRTPSTLATPSAADLAAQSGSQAARETGTASLQAFAAMPALDGNSDGFVGEVAAAGDTAATTVPATTTTVWVEPTLPPASEWVDAGNGVLVPDLLLRIRFCESTNNYEAANTGSSARGAYQFLTKSWDWYGHAEVTGVTQAHLATPAQQDQAALTTLQSEGTSPWLASRGCWADENIDPNYATAVPRQTTSTTADPSTSTTAGETTTSVDEPASTTDTTVASTTETTAPTTTDTTTTSTSDTTASTTATSSSSTSG